MKKFTILIIALIVTLNCHSQELKRKSVTLGNGFEETFYVLKSDKSIKQGEFTLKYFDGVIQSGFYKNNTKSGLWKYFSINNSLEFMYNYDSLKIVSDTLGKHRMPLYSEGSSYFIYLISKFIKYPNAAKESGKSGFVFISFTVDKEGTVKDFLVDTGCGDISLNNEALRVVKQVATTNS